MYKINGSRYKIAIRYVPAQALHVSRSAQRQPALSALHLANLFMSLKTNL